MAQRDPYLGLSARERTQQRVKDFQASSAANKAQSAAKSQEQKGGDTQANATTKDGPPVVLRYPLGAIDSSTDRLLIKIYDQVRSSDIFGLDKVLSGGGQTDITKIAGLPEFNATFNNKDAKYNDRVKQLEKNAIYIYLPIPNQIQDALTVSYAEDSITPLEVAGLSAMSVATDASQRKSAQDIINSLIQGNIAGLDAKTTEAVKTSLSGIALNSLGANVDANALLSRASGQVLQSNLELLFSGVTLRSFPFVFDFAPRDGIESKRVMEIIRAMKVSMVPKKGSNPALFIKAPKVFQLEYISGEKAHPFLNKFKICALTGMSVNYTASGTYATYDDGTPVHIQMECTFREINPIYFEDYANEPDGVGF